MEPVEAACGKREGGRVVLRGRTHEETGVDARRDGGGRTGEDRDGRFGSDGS
jgi:hypothetical protein